MSEMRERVQTMVMSFPIKKRISTELLIDRMAALLLGETRIGVP